MLGGVALVVIVLVLCFAIELMSAINARKVIGVWDDSD
jgi:Na+-transporting methylmalonyl-CoA/oxaloacetate decarboxylase gamma subunit